MTTTTRGPMEQTLWDSVNSIQARSWERLLAFAREQDAIQRELVEACKGAYPMLVLAAYEANKRGDSDARARTSAAAEGGDHLFGRAKGEA